MERAGLLLGPLRRLTAGTAVLRYEASDQGPVVVAPELEDGAELWRTPLPSGAQMLRSQSGHVVGDGEGVVFGLGAAAL